MDNEKQVVITRVLNAPRERVWQAWTDPIQLAAWWGSRGVTIPVCEIDVREGGALRIVILAGPELGDMAGERWPMEGTYRRVVEHELLDFTSNAVTENGSMVLKGETTVTFQDDDGKTTLTVKAGAQGMLPEAPQMLAGMEMGWNQQLDKLTALLAN